MRFEWDEDKNLENVRKHGIDFEDVKPMFVGPIFIKSDDREDYGEDRWVAVGLVEQRIIAVCYTEPEPEAVRFISCRKATPNKRQQFTTYLKDRLEPG